MTTIRTGGGDGASPAGVYAVTLTAMVALPALPEGGLDEFVDGISGQLAPLGLTSLNVYAEPLDEEEP